MPSERYYYPELLSEDQQVILNEKEHHHLIHVMRTRPGDVVEVVNGKGQLAEAVVETLGKKQASLRIKSALTTTPSTKKLILAQGIPRLHRLELIIEKGTELGMAELWLFPAARSERKEITESQSARFASITIAAMKQCGRLFLPEIRILPALKHWKKNDQVSLFFGDLSPKASPFLTVCQNLKLTNETVLCIGPESGFSPEETEMLQNLNAQGVVLHSNILTTDTAALAGLALFSQLM